MKEGTGHGYRGIWQARDCLHTLTSRGPGRGCAEMRAEEGVDPVLNGCIPETLKETAQSIRARFRVSVEIIPDDIAIDDAQGRTRR